MIVHQGFIEEGVHLIEKPFSAEALLRRVREILAGETEGADPLVPLAAVKWHRRAACVGWFRQAGIR